MLSGRQKWRAAIVCIAAFAGQSIVLGQEPPAAVDPPSTQGANVDTDLPPAPLPQPSGAVNQAAVLPSADEPGKFKQASQPTGQNTPPTPPNTGTEVPLTEAPETTVVGQASGIGGQGGPVSGNTVVEGATRTAVPLGQIGSSVSVVTAEQIRERQIYSVTEALRLLPGVDVVQSGNAGNVSSVFIRGANSDQTKVLLDGIIMNNPVTVGRFFDFSTMSVDNIERIEVIRGPQSVLYGSDAIGGVINIITKKGSGPIQKAVNAYGGSYGTSREALSVGGSNQSFYSSWAGSYFDTRGFSAADKRMGNTEKDAFHLGTLAGRMGWTPARNFDVDFVFRLNEANVNIDNGGGPLQDDPNNKTFSELIATRTQIRYQGPAEIWEQKISYATTHQGQRSNNPVDALNPNDSFFAQSNGFLQLVDWQHNVNLLENNVLTFGGIYQQEDGDSRFASTSIFGPFNSNSPSRQLRDAAIYAQDRITIGDRWFTTFGTRQDHYSQAGTASTYRVTTLYRTPITETAFRGSIGSGFKAPTIFQLYDAFFGNAALKPEESKGWDIGVEQPVFDGDIVLGGTYFRNDFSNLIAFNNDPRVNSYYNIGAAVSTGVEVSSFFKLTQSLDATINYTHLNARDRLNDIPLLRRPRDRVGMIFNQKMLNNKANLNLTFNYVGNRFDQDFTQFPSPTVVLHNYIIVNTALTYNLTRQIQLFARGDNLTNEVYQDVFGYGSAAISGYGGANITW